LFVVAVVLVVFLLFCAFARPLIVAGSFLVEDVEDAHPQRDHHHPQHEDATVDGNIFRMPVASPTTTVIHTDSQHHLQQS
jgi:hypothetical protein